MEQNPKKNPKGSEEREPHPPPYQRVPDPENQRNAVDHQNPENPTHPEGQPGGQPGHVRQPSSSANPLDGIIRPEFLRPAASHQQQTTNETSQNQPKPTAPATETDKLSSTNSDPKHHVSPPIPTPPLHPRTSSGGDAFPTTSSAFSAISPISDHSLSSSLYMYPVYPVPSFPDLDGVNEKELLTKKEIVEQQVQLTSLTLMDAEKRYHKDRTGDNADLCYEAAHKLHNAKHKLLAIKKRLLNIAHLKELQSSEIILPKLGPGRTITEAQHHAFKSFKSTEFSTAWDKLVSYGQTHNFSEENYKMALQFCIPDDQYETFRQYRHEPLQILIEKMMKLHGKQNKLQNYLQDLSNFSRQTYETIETCMGRLELLLSRTEVIVPEENRYARYSMLMREHLKKCVTAPAKKEIEKRQAKDLVQGIVTPYKHLLNEAIIAERLHSDELTHSTFVAVKNSRQDRHVRARSPYNLRSKTPESQRQNRIIKSHSPSRDRLTPKPPIHDADGDMIFRDKPIQQNPSPPHFAPHDLRHRATLFRSVSNPQDIVTLHNNDQKRQNSTENPLNEIQTETQSHPSPQHTHETRNESFHNNHGELSQQPPFVPKKSYHEPYQNYDRQRPHFRDRPQDFTSSNAPYDSNKPFLRPYQPFNQYQTRYNRQTIPPPTLIYNTGGRWSANPYRPYTQSYNQNRQQYNYRYQPYNNNRYKRDDDNTQDRQKN